MSTAKETRATPTAWSAKLSSTIPSRGPSAANSAGSTPVNGPATSAPPPNAWAKGSAASRLGGTSNQNNSWSSVAAKRASGVRPEGGNSAARSPERTGKQGRGAGGNSNSNNNHNNNITNNTNNNTNNSSSSNHNSSGAGSGKTDNRSKPAGQQKGAQHALAHHPNLPAPGVSAPGHVLFFSSPPDPLSIKYSKTVSGEEVTHYPALPATVNGLNTPGSASNRAGTFKGLFKTFGLTEAHAEKGGSGKERERPRDKRNRTKG